MIQKRSIALSIYLSLVLVLVLVTVARATPLAAVDKNMFKRHGIFVFQLNQLRLRDNILLHQAHSDCDAVNHVFVYNPSHYVRTKKGNLRCSKRRLQFIHECVTDIRSQLALLGGKLDVHVGTIEDVLSLYKKCNSSSIYCYNSYTDEESKAIISIRSVLDTTMATAKLITCDGGTLLDVAKLPINSDMSDFPHTFTEFRKLVETHNTQDMVYAPMDVPSFIKPYVDDISSSSSIGDDITVNELWSKLRDDDATTADYEVSVTSDDRSAFQLNGGETHAIDRLAYYLQPSILLHYKERRNGLIGQDYSTKLAPYLSTGCIAATAIYHALNVFEVQHNRQADENTYMLHFELLWRDYLSLYAKKMKNRLFHIYGCKENNTSTATTTSDDVTASATWSNDASRIDAWKNGTTGYPFIDANMIELKQTGYMSNRGRQVVASFLTRDMNINWQYGAEHFESLLVDYDVSSNWGNWQYSAGVGSDPRADRYFNVVKQGVMYDPDALFIKQWIPELANAPAEVLHDVKLLTDDVREQYSITAYPKTIACDLLHASYTPSKRDKKKKKQQFHGGVPGI